MVSLLEPQTWLLISAAIFTGAVVSGLVGFAFSAVAGAVLLHVLPPVEAVPLMMACSMVTQAVSLVSLRRSVKWSGSPTLIVAGLIGVVPALYLLRHADPHIFRVGFGIFLVGYAGWMLLRPAAEWSGEAACRLRAAMVGFGGGLVGGLTAMPGALPTIWCDRRGMPKDQQRGLVQPYVTVLQAFALMLLIAQNSISAKTLLGLTVCLPALAAGAALGVVMFHRIGDAFFRSAVLVVLLFAGTMLVL